jgi:hypothetical protein
MNATAKALLLVVALCAAPAFAQVAIPPLKIYDEITLLPVRFRLKMTGAGVTCTDSAPYTVCTIAGGGGAATIAALYAAGAATADSVLALDSTRGPLVLKYDAIGIADTAGLLLQQTTAATNGNQKYSPALQLEGKSFTSGASQVEGWEMRVRPVQDSKSVLDFRQRIGAGAYATVWSFDYSTTSYPLLISNTSTAAVYDVDFDGYYISGGLLGFRSNGGLRWTMDGSTFYSSDAVGSVGARGLRLLTTYVGSVVATRPACAVANDEAQIRVKRAAAGAKSCVEACLKGADDAYHWEDVYCSAN